MLSKAGFPPTLDYSAEVLICQGSSFKVFESKEYGDPLKFISILIKAGIGAHLGHLSQYRTITGFFANKTSYREIKLDEITDFFFYIKKRAGSWVYVFDLDKRNLSICKLESYDSAAQEVDLIRTINHLMSINPTYGELLTEQLTEFLSFSFTLNSMNLRTFQIKFLLKL